MDVYDAIKTRRSVRAYQDKPVPEDVLKRILEAARLAPSASNRQDWKFIVVRDSGNRRAVAQAANNQMFIAQAPVIIVAVSLNPDRIMSCEVPSYAVDLAIAVDHITLAATAEGLGTCWIGAFSQREMKKVLDIPERYKVVTLTPLGYPADSPRPKVRKPLEEIVCYEKFKE
ncbi:MAG TPA: nitroreductase family protein [bacterium]|jgi:nitroreductase|nr:nitroreductase family protein [bacterium]HOL55092.1 nitroreductase family protein [bacterium]HPO82116.1 nitroreductase family protein [bacterium]HRR91490.1 nitroreductase family protein [bacterium]HRU32048.1 nitroreductase family protein [bacterium]